MAEQIRCAIYTRKSTSEGLDQEFTTLDAQRESAVSYINSQKAEGWTVIDTLYDDGGYTGATMDRPGLTKLLDDVKAHKIDCVVVYKVDRLSRSLLDFSKLLEMFDMNNVTFVSVTQHFNTQNSMGRLTLNILLSFAQFEREMISERTRDKMAAARRKGKWLGGRPILGYNLDTENKKLIVNKEEAKLVRRIFTLYAEGMSLLGIVKMLNNEELRTKRVVTKTGKVFGDITYGKSLLAAILNKRLYTGKIPFDGEVFNGEHKAIISEELFEKVEKKLVENKNVRMPYKYKPKYTNLLSSRLTCSACKTKLIGTYTKKNKTILYRYYVCTNAQKRGYDICPTRSIRADAMEEAVILCLHKEFLKLNMKDEAALILSSMHEEKRRLIFSSTKNIVVDAKQQTMTLTLWNDTEKTIKFKITRPSYNFSHRKSTRIKKIPRFMQNFLLVHHIDLMLENGTFKGFSDAAKYLNLSYSRISQIMPLIFLSPKIKEDVLLTSVDKLQKVSERKLRDIAAEPEWEKQEEMWGKIALQ